MPSQAIYQLYPQISPSQLLVSDRLSHSISTIRIRHSGVTRTGRHWTGLPSCGIGAHEEFKRAALDHEIVMFEPIPRPVLAIDQDRLDEVAAVCVVQIMRNDTERGIVVDGHIDVLEPWTLKKINRLCYDWIQAQHLPNEPTVQGSCVAVARYAVVGIVEELVGQCPRLLDGLVLLVEVVIQVRGRKIRFVADVHDGCDAGSIGAQTLLRRVGLEYVVQTGFEGVITAHECDQSLDIVRHNEGVLEWRSLVADGRPLTLAAKSRIVV